MQKFVFLNDEWTLKQIKHKLFLHNYKKNRLFEVPLSSKKFFLFCDGRMDFRELIYKRLLTTKEINELMENEILLTSKNKRVNDIDYIFYDKNFLKHISIDVTSKCSLNCKHCYISKVNTKKNLKFDEIKNILLDAKKMGCLSVELSGGNLLCVQTY